MKEKKQRVIKTRISFPHKGCGMPGSRRARKQRRFSRTDGKEKTQACKAKWMHRYACSARSYKNKNYHSLMAALDRKAMR